ncbi:MAG: hypothetical protein VCB42_03705 [Myxococcota bacterium]
MTTANRSRWGRTAARRCGAVAVLALLSACQREPVPEVPQTCGPAEIKADKTASVPRPSAAEADFSFSGDLMEQVEFVWIQPQGRYHYAERWNLGMVGTDKLQVNVGWDWKRECRIERCEKPDGSLCCFQVCEDGGASGAGTEPPDRFGCMNPGAGGDYQWFLNGLRAAGIEGLEGCFEPRPPRVLDAHGAEAPDNQREPRETAEPSETR